MCRLYRDGTSWKVEAIGDFLQDGYVEDEAYWPILYHIDKGRSRLAAA